MFEDIGKIKVCKKTWYNSDSDFSINKKINKKEIFVEKIKGLFY